MRLARLTSLRVFVVVTTTISTQLVAAPPVDGVTEKDVAAWIKQLDANDFATRELATQRLIDGGEISVGPVEEAIKTANLEVLNRGMSVLRKLSITQTSNDADPRASEVTREKAMAALERLVTSGSPLVARHARLAQVNIQVSREEIAARTIRVFGGHVHKSQDYNGQSRTEVEIGKNWRGKDSDLAKIRDLPNLDRLSIKRAKITDASLAEIANHKELKFLDLLYVNVSDESIKHLLTLPSLQHVRLYGTRITDQGQRQLAARMTARGVSAVGLQEIVDYKQGAFLGVLCMPAPNPCLIREVTADSAAENAGLAAGDIITKYDDQPVPHFDALRGLIKLNRAGESKKIVVFRSGEPLYRSHPLKKDDKLGITCEQHTVGLKITKIEKKSIAEEWELKVGDVIMSFNREPVPTPSELQDLFDAQLKAVLRRAEKDDPEIPVDPFGLRNQYFSDTCTITFARGAEELEKTVTFGEWE